MNQQSHIAQHIEKFTSQEIVENRLRLRTSIEATRWLALQGCSFRGHDESIASMNGGNFLELLSIIASFNDEVTKVLDKAPRNASYTSPTLQKQILQVLATKVKGAIREEIGHEKFCIIVDEARDESKKEQMSIVLRFVDRDGFIQERFFGVVHVKDTSASTLKECIFSILSRHNLAVQNIWGQGYDGASNMRGEWNGLKALILDECPYAYYVHCFAHRLQLALEASSKEVIPVHQFFTKLNSIINVVGASYGTTHAHRGDADTAYEVLEISNMLCQALQLQSQDILNAMHLVSSTKLHIQTLRDSGWDELVASVKSFCETVNITVPNFDAQYIARRGRARHQQDELTIGHHYKVDIFNAVIDSQLQELSNRFDDKAIELIILSSSLDPKEMRVSFRIDDVCKLVEKFYTRDFEDYEILQLRMQLEHFEHVQQLPDFRILESISDLCQWLAKTRKSNIYPLVFRVVTLILTLPVSTATTERSFSAMNIVKTTLLNKMEDEFLSDCLLVYIEKQIAKQFSIDSIIDDFCDIQERRSKF
ncbi:uncharacterized protein LOC116013093 [Ipomoea triloba]|uniref:uncharacterized protein LOC116013093 n=1 Tax=Ipomoea triloba TaxID=35885 RepID=UPI00125DBE68|nr:uncharacterized protein LOC116013093 [Ipomoea triloba]